MKCDSAADLPRRCIVTIDWHSEQERLRRRVCASFPWARKYDEDIAQEFITRYWTHGGDMDSSAKFRHFVRTHTLTLKGIAWVFVDRDRILGKSVSLDIPTAKQLADTNADFEEPLTQQMDLRTVINLLPRPYREALHEWTTAAFSKKPAVQALVAKGCSPTYCAASRLLSRAHAALIVALREKGGF
jgi:hypothetical protein